MIEIFNNWKWAGHYWLLCTPYDCRCRTPTPGLSMPLNTFVSLEWSVMNHYINNIAPPTI